MPYYQYKLSSGVVTAWVNSQVTALPDGVGQILINDIIMPTTIAINGANNHVLEISTGNLYNHDNKEFEENSDKGDLSFIQTLSNKK